METLNLLQISCKLVFSEFTGTIIPAKTKEKMEKIVLSKNSLTTWRFWGNNISHPFHIHIIHKLILQEMPKGRRTLSDLCFFYSNVKSYIICAVYQAIIPFWSHQLVKWLNNYSCEIGPAWLKEVSDQHCRFVSDWFARNRNNLLVNLTHQKECF